MAIARLLFGKWWVTALRGILLIILSVYVFQHPVAVLTGASFWVGATVLFTGVLGAISWMFGDESDRDGMALVWSIVTVAFGVVMLTHLLATMKVVTIVFGAWILLTSVQLGRIGWALRHQTSLGWMTVGAGVLSSVAATMMMLDIGAGAIGVSALFALPILLTGIALVIVSVAKKALGSRLRATLEPLMSPSA
jgi:uncharacterized membrane protein HdeD (DUF308 family)